MIYAVSFTILMILVVVYALFRKPDMRTPLEKRRDILKHSMEGLNPPSGYKKGEVFVDNA